MLQCRTKGVEKRPVVYVCVQIIIQYAKNPLTKMSCAVKQDIKVLVYMDMFGWVEFHIAFVCGVEAEEMFVSGSLCACACVYLSLIVILSTCSQVLSVLFIITTTPVRLTRGAFSLSVFLFASRS